MPRGLVSLMSFPQVAASPACANTSYLRVYIQFQSLLRCYAAQPIIAYKPFSRAVNSKRRGHFQTPTYLVRTLGLGHFAQIQPVLLQITLTARS